MNFKEAQEMHCSFLNWICDDTLDVYGIKV